MQSLLLAALLSAGGAAPAPAARTNAAAPTSSAPPAARPSTTSAEAQPQQEEQQEEEAEPPTLESRIPPVSGRSFTTRHKFELSFDIGFSLNDAFLEKFIPQLSVGYHIDEQFYVGLRGGYAFDIDAGHVVACTGALPNATCGSPTSDQLKQLPGNLTATVTAQFAWTPIYGKLNIFAERVVHFDLSALVDAGVLILGPQPDPNVGSVSPEFSFGLGQHFFFTSNLALLAEFREVLYSSDGVQSQLVFNLGLSLLL